MTAPERGTGRAIAIVGGGFGGTALATSLLRRGVGDVAVHLVEPRPQPGWGVAYGGAEPWHILNVPADRMSPWDETPLDFLDWAKARGPTLGWPQAAAAGPQTYLPRRLFGHYVQARFEEARQAAAGNGPRLHLHRGSVSSIGRYDGGFILTLAEGGAISAGQVVLATGFRPPGWPFAVVGNSPRLVRNPWAPDALAAIGRNDSVLLVGTGLSMVDMIYSLSARGHRGKVTAVSRHGLLPRVHGAAEERPPLIAETDAAKGVVHSLRLFRRAVAEGAADWRSAMDALRPHIDGLWRTLSPVEQDRCRRHLKPFWEVHRHRMPAESADLLLQRQARGLLEVKPLRVRKVEVSETGVQVNGGFFFDHLVNCTPPAAPLGAEADPLAKALLAAGLVRPHRTGAGFDVEPDGAIRDAEGQPVAGLFTLGPPRCGYAQETTAVPHIKPQLSELTRLLLGKAGHCSRL
ncbi:MAG TPA: FAD/NAD(P)-binding protein [Candidatus Sulfotelmatobacter sp.]|jgi:uncharacterized NAD(P)/FAD-binding protein YdhS|nr:FAD/NAD(P)-binding protein [Candidatus Sulfotelmatobacter sp.]